MRNQAISSTDEASHKIYQKKNSFLFQRVCVLACVADQHPTENKGMSQAFTKMSKGPFQKGASNNDSKKIICNTQTKYKLIGDH